MIPLECVDRSVLPAACQEDQSTKPSNASKLTPRRQLPDPQPKSASLGKIIRRPLRPLAMLPVGMDRQAVARLFPFTPALPSIELFGIGDEIYDGQCVAPVDVVRGHEDLLVFDGLINSARPFTECYLGVSASQSLFD